MGEQNIASRVLHEFTKRPVRVRRSRHVTLQPISELGLIREPTTQLELSHVEGVLAQLQHQIPQSTEVFDPGTDSHETLYRALLPHTELLRKNLDTLDAQLHDKNQGFLVQVGSSDEEIGQHTIRFVTLDLYPPQAKEKDTRIPWICIGGAPSITEQNYALWMSLALAGQKVMIIPYPERNDGAPSDWDKRVAEHAGGTFGLHAAVVRQVLEELASQQGVTDINVMAHSGGVAIALEALAVDNPPVQLHDMVADAPIGFTQQNVLGLGKDFGLKQNLRTIRRTEDNIKMLQQGKAGKAPTLFGLVQIARLCAKKQITPELLEKLRVKGNLSVFLGEKDPITRGSVRTSIEQTLLHDVSPELTNKVLLHVISGADHPFPVTHGIGFVQYALRELADVKRNGGYMSGALQTLPESNFATSGIEYLLQQAVRRSL